MNSCPASKKRMNSNSFDLDRNVNRLRKTLILRANKMNKKG